MKRLMTLKQQRQKTSIIQNTKREQVGSTDEFTKSRTKWDIKTTDQNINFIRTLSCAVIWCIKKLYFAHLL